MSVIIEFKSDGEDGPKKSSFEHVLKLANGLVKGSHSEDVAHVLKAAALAQLDPVGTEDDPRRRPGEAEAAQEASSPAVADARAGIRVVGQ